MDMSDSTFISFNAMKQTTLNKLGNYLGLSQFELELIEPEIHIDKVGGKIVKYIIMFKKNAAKTILNKIKGLALNNTVSMAINDVGSRDFFFS